MVRSMTGYGKALAVLPGKSIIIEIKSLNSKQFDMNLRLPAILREREPEFRSIIAKAIERGKVDVNVSVDYTGSDLPASINKPLALAYYHELKSLAQETGETNADLLSIVMKMPDVTRQLKEETDETEWNEIYKAFNTALNQYEEFRKHEGALLEEDFSARIKTIQNLLIRVEPFEAGRNNLLREKLRASVSEFIDNNTLDANRFEQEIIYYLEKLDITEEKVRLQKHCDYFLDTLNEKEANGRKLNFITQEIGREINTLGSKANDAGMQKLVVQMKDELEKIKEQLANIL
ncbi:MAG: YicC family protein [Bacteroidales bacterium]|nr:YicC family protein [Bacteroidales bacterium]MBK9357997.1 YicC family protein [Bacteroidales bacterium]